VRLKVTPHRCHPEKGAVGECAVGKQAHKYSLLAIKVISVKVKLHVGIFWCSPAEFQWCMYFAGALFTSKSEQAKFKIKNLQISSMRLWP
jgi:hypothetical protein